MFWKSHKVNQVIRIEDIYSLFCADYPNGYTFPGEAHNFWECVYVKSGEVCICADGRVYQLRENSIIFHKPLEFHRFTVSHAGGASVLTFSFSMNGALSAFFRDKVFQLYDRQMQILDELCAYAESKAAGLEAGYEKYLSAFERDIAYSQTVATYICQLLLSLTDAHSLCAASTESDAEDFSKAVDYMNSNIERNILISDLAAHLNISPSGVKRIFLKYSGISIHKYFLKLKINAATELLRMGLTVSETADRLGFSSQGYFSGRYKKETGIAPGEIKLRSREAMPEL